MQYLLLTVFHTRKEDILLEESGSQSEVTWKPFLHNPSTHSPHHIFLKQPPTPPPFLNDIIFKLSNIHIMNTHKGGGGGEIEGNVSTTVKTMTLH